jgi:nicotinamide-nucleotide amidase
MRANSTLEAPVFPHETLMAARLLLGEAEERKLRLVTAESCTGGLIAGALTEIPGSSAVVERGFIVYSNRAKEELLGVPGDLIADAGAVSEAVARAMAEGALRESNAHISVAVTGVAGPGGGTAFKPVGLVHIACARENHAIRHQMLRLGDIGRTEIRLHTVNAAIALMQEMIVAASGSNWR